jgi:hypothetical protein
MRIFETLRIAPGARLGFRTTETDLGRRPCTSRTRDPLGLFPERTEKSEGVFVGRASLDFLGAVQQLMALPGRVYESWRDSIFESFPRGTGPLGISLETEFRLGWRGCLSAWLLFALPAGLVRCQRRNGPPVRSRPAGFLSLTPGPFPSSAGMNSMPADSRAV